MRYLIFITVLAFPGLVLSGACLPVWALRRQQGGPAAPVAAPDEAIRDDSRKDISMHKPRRAKKKLALAAVLAAGCVAVGVAWAAWTVG